MTYDHLHTLAKHAPIILASGSPRRFELLSEIGVPFEKIVPDLEEARGDGEGPFDYALRLAEDKARAVASRTNNGAICIGSDTVVALGDDNLEKPVDEEDAFRILSTLAGRTHVVCTALALARGNEVIVSAYDTTEVKFNLVTEKQIRDYIKTGEPADKAGAYGIQGMGAFLVDSIDGNLDTVIGLPRNLLNSLARDALKKLQIG